jgi:hypothetical protein
VRPARAGCVASTPSKSNDQPMQSRVSGRSSQLRGSFRRCGQATRSGSAAGWHRSARRTALANHDVRTASSVSSCVDGDSAQKATAFLGRPPPPRPEYAMRPAWILPDQLPRRLACECRGSSGAAAGSSCGSPVARGGFPRRSRQPRLLRVTRTPSAGFHGSRVEVCYRNHSHGSRSLSAMSPLTVLDAVEASRRSCSASDRISFRGFGLGEVRRRDSSMAGINVSPVHGWHGVCERCARETRGH